MELHCGHPLLFPNPLPVNGQTRFDYQTMVPWYQVFSQTQVLTP